MFSVIKYFQNVLVGTIWLSVNPSLFILDLIYILFILVTKNKLCKTQNSRTGLMKLLEVYVYI